MKTKTPKFFYGPSCKLVNWGCSFDSLTELKFAISIMEDYAFLCQPISIYYDLSSRQPVNRVRRCHRRYTPDFLIRHKETGQAFLVEIKPRAMEGHSQLSLRRQVAENFINQKGYDWQFRIFFGDEIILTEEQLTDFEECSRLKTKSDRAKWFKQYCQKWGRSNSSFLLNKKSEAMHEFIFYGYQETGTSTAYSGKQIIGSHVSSNF